MVFLNTQTLQTSIEVKYLLFKPLFIWQQFLDNLLSSIAVGSVIENVPSFTLIYIDLASGM